MKPEPYSENDCCTLPPGQNLSCKVPTGQAFHDIVIIDDGVDESYIGMSVLRYNLEVGPDLRITERSDMIQADTLSEHFYNPLFSACNIVEPILVTHPQIPGTQPALPFIPLFQVLPSDSQISGMPAEDGIRQNQV